MAKITRTDLFNYDRTAEGDLGPQALEAVAPLATGKNKDGTDFALGVSGTFGNPPDYIASGTLGAAGQAVTVAFPAPAGSVAVYVTNTGFALNYLFEASLDGGVTYPVAMPLTTIVANSTAQILTGSNGVLANYKGPVAAGVTHFRVRCVTYTSGTANVTVAGSISPMDPIVSIGNNVLLGATNAAIGVAALPATWYNEVGSGTITATLAANTTGLGAAHDTLGTVASGAATNNARGGRVRLSSFADQTHAIGVEWSDDTVNWDQFDADVASAAVVGKAVAKLDQPVYARYYRARVSNSSLTTAFTQLRCRSLTIAAN